MHCNAAYDSLETEASPTLRCMIALQVIHFLLFKDRFPLMQRTVPLMERITFEGESNEMVFLGFSPINMALQSDWQMSGCCGQSPRRFLSLSPL